MKLLLLSLMLFSIAACTKPEPITPTTATCSTWVIKQPLNYEMARVSYTTCDGETITESYIFSDGKRLSSDTITAQTCPHGYCLLKDSGYDGEPIIFYQVK